MRRFLGFCTFAFAISLLVPAAGRAGPPQWPDEAEKKLEKADSDLLSLQRKRALARLHGKKEASKEMDEEFKDMQKGRLKLLQDSHQY